PRPRGGMGRNADHNGIFPGEAGPAGRHLPRFPILTFFEVSKIADHFKFHSPVRSTDSAWPSTNTTLQKRLLCRLRQTRDMKLVLPDIRSPGSSRSLVQGSTQALSANSGTRLDSLTG